MFRRRRQLGMRQRRYRTPFSGSSYLYAADADFRGRAATMCIGPVAVGDIVKVNVRWMDSSIQVPGEGPVRLVEQAEYAPVPMTYSMISRMLCEQGAPRSIGISGWATGFIPTVTLNTDDYLRQWVLEFAHRIFPSLSNTLRRYGIPGFTRPRAAQSLLEEARGIIGRLREIDMADRGAIREVVGAIWNLLRLPTIEAATAGGNVEAYVHIPYTYLARGKPPRALRASMVWVFAKTQLEHEVSERAQLKGYHKYSLKDDEFAGKDETANTFIARANAERINLLPAETIGQV